MHRQPANAGMSTRSADPLGLGQTARASRGVFHVQVWLGIAVLLCAILIALFVFSVVAVPRQHMPTDTSPGLSSVQTKPLSNLSVTLAVTPGNINATNTVIAQIKDRRNGQFVTDARVKVSINMDQMNMGTVQASMSVGTLAYRAVFVQDTTFSMTGIWDITLTVQLPYQGQSIILFQMWLG